MSLNSTDIALIAATFAGILSIGIGVTFLLARVRVQKWIGGAIGRFMQNLAKEAAEEEGGSALGSGVLNLGGFKIDIGMIREIAPLLIEYGPKLLALAKQFGLVKGGGMEGGGFGP